MTLYHWDLPQVVIKINKGSNVAYKKRLENKRVKMVFYPLNLMLLKALENKGGWLNPDVADWFVEYAE